MLSASGVTIDPETLVSEVYLPERQGSLQVELKATARRHGRIPYELAPTLAELFAEVAAGKPALILQNLALNWLPRWHYAVVVGYDADREQVLLRSGRTERRGERLHSFERSWGLADRWALLLLKPGELPAFGEANTYLRSVVESSPVIGTDAVSAALLAGAQRWPENADMNFALANQLQQMGETADAAAYYRMAIASDTAHIGALNNFADLLLTEGCVVAAGDYAGRAQESVDADSPLAPLIQSTIREIDLASATVASQDSTDSEYCTVLSP